MCSLQLAHYPPTLHVCPANPYKRQLDPSTPQAHSLDKDNLPLLVLLLLVPVGQRVGVLGLALHPPGHPDRHRLELILDIPRTAVREREVGVRVRGAAR